MTISERVKRAANEAGGVPKLAARAGVGRQTLYDIIDKGHMPSGRTLLRLLASGVIRRADLASLDTKAA